MIEIWDGQTDLRPLAEAWNKEVNGDFDIEQGMRDMTFLSEDINSEVFVLTHDDMIEGTMGITILDMFFTQDCYSAVRYWYVLPEYRSHALRLVNVARKWSRDMACTKMMICENRLSVPCADFYKTLGFTAFETVYIGDL